MTYSNIYSLNNYQNKDFGIPFFERQIATGTAKWTTFTALQPKENLSELNLVMVENGKAVSRSVVTNLFVYGLKNDLDYYKSSGFAVTDLYSTFELISKLNIPELAGLQVVTQEDEDFIHKVVFFNKDSKESLDLIRYIGVKVDALGNLYKNWVNLNDVRNPQAVMKLFGLFLGGYIGKLKPESDFNSSAYHWLNKIAQANDLNDLKRIVTNYYFDMENLLSDFEVFYKAYYRIETPNSDKFAIAKNFRRSITLN